MRAIIIAHSTLKCNTRVKNKPESEHYLWLKDSVYLYLDIYERIQATESRVKIHNYSSVEQVYEK